MTVWWQLVGTGYAHCEYARNNNESNHVVSLIVLLMSATPILLTPFIGTRYYDYEYCQYDSCCSHIILTIVYCCYDYCVLLSL